MSSKIKYSPSETRLLDILRKRKTPIDSDALCDLYYGDIEKPFNAQGSVNSTMRALMRKCIHNREPFTITKSERRGPHPIEFHLVTKEARKVS